MPLYNQINFVLSLKQGRPTTILLEGEPGSHFPDKVSWLDIPHLQEVILTLNYPVVLGV